MLDLLMIMGDVMPFDAIIDQLEKSISDYKTDPSETNKKMLSSCCALFALQRQTLAALMELLKR